MVREIMGDLLNPHQEKVKRERVKRKTRFRYCSVCRCLSWLYEEDGKWICQECGYVVRKERYGRSSNCDNQW